MTERPPTSAPSPIPVLTAAEMQAWDRRAIDGLGVPERVLMEAAGRAAARVLHQLYPSGPVVAAVGKGNNGGDALVLLRSLRAWGREVVAVPVGGASARPDLLHGWEIPTASADDPDVLRDAAVLVDGILGTGASGAPRGAAAAMIRALSSAGRPVVALDGPSGIDLTTGAAAGDAVEAETTLSFGAPKRGLLLYPGRRHAGRLVVVEVGFPPLRPAELSAALIDPAWVRARLPRLAPNAHKGQAGKVVILGGHPGMGGAAILAAMGALRAGAGGVRVISAEENRIAIQTAVPEALFVDREGEGVESSLEPADVLIAGPGMGKDERVLRILRRALDAIDCPLLMDADAVSLLARDPELIPERLRERTVLTPHPAEMGRLLGVPTEEVTADPFAAVERAAERFGCAVLLKGWPTLVAAAGEPTMVNATGHSGIATGGMGDTLAGLVGAMLGAGCSAREGAAIGIFLAGRAAELAGRGRSLLPRDVAEALPAALADQPPFGSLRDPDVVLDLPAPR